MRFPIPENEDFVAAAFRETAKIHGEPEIATTYQGSQFNSEAYTQELLGRDIRISMHGKGPAVENVSIERCWQAPNTCTGVHSVQLST